MLNERQRSLQGEMVARTQAEMQVKALQAELDSIRRQTTQAIEEQVRERKD